MKKIILMLFVMCAGINAFAKTTVIDPMKNSMTHFEREHIMPGDVGAYIANPSKEYTVVFYVHPLIEGNPTLKSDPLGISCNGYSLLLAPGSSFACTVKPLKNPNSSLELSSLSYSIDSQYYKNGADISTMYID